MAYKIDGTDLVINGWENGISDNPYSGINDMRGVNIISTPGEASVSFAPILNSLPSCSGTINTIDTGADTFTVKSVTGTIVNGQALVFTTSAGTIVAGTTYWIYAVSAGVYQIYTNPYADNPAVNLAGTETGTFSSINMKDIVCFE